MYIYFYEADFALSEYYFAFNFCQVVIEKFDFKVGLRYGAETSSLKLLYISDQFSQIPDIGTEERRCESTQYIQNEAI